MSEREAALQAYHRFIGAVGDLGPNAALPTRQLPTAVVLDNHSEEDAWNG